MSSPCRPTARRLAAFGLLAGTLFLGGCVYLRLLELKRQLAEFDKHFTLQTTDGVRLNFLDPVLLSDDVRWFGFAPETTRKLGHAEQWRVRWVKQLPPGAREAATYDVVLDLNFVDDKLTRLAISDGYFVFMPKQIFTAAIRSLGGAKVDRQKRTVENDVSLSLQEAPADWPTRQTATAQLGQPSDESAGGGKIILHYHYASAAPGGKGGVFDLKLVFDATTDALIGTHGLTPAGNLDLNFRRPAPAAAPSG